MDSGNLGQKANTDGQGVCVVHEGVCCIWRDMMRLGVLFMGECCTMGRCCTGGDGVRGYLAMWVHFSSTVI